MAESSISARVRPWWGPTLAGYLARVCLLPVKAVLSLCRIEILVHNGQVIRRTKVAFKIRIDLDGDPKYLSKNMSEWPEDLRVREMPEVNR